MKKIAVFVVVLCLIVVCAVSCNGSKAVTEKLCASNWRFEWDVQVEVYEFNNDGTYTLTIDSVWLDKIVQTGTYSVSDGTIKLIRDTDSYESELTYTYENDVLSVTCRNKTVTK